MSACKRPPRSDFVLFSSGFWNFAVWQKSRPKVGGSFLDGTIPLPHRGRPPTSQRGHSPVLEAAELRKKACMQELALVVDSMHGQLKSLRLETEL